MSIDISVIIPVYNVERYLAKCMESVLAQKGVDYEIILVDDGSTDGSGKLCDTYAEQNEHVSVIHKKNQGLGYARNDGIEVAVGKYICFIDSDDWIVDGALKKLFMLSEKNRADLVWFEAKVVDSRAFHLDMQPEERLEFLDNETLMRRYLQGLPATVWLKFYRRELFRDIRFSNVPIHEDVYSMHMILKEVQRAVMTNQIYYIQYVREGSLIQSRFSTKNLISIECGKRILEFTEMYYPKYRKLAVELLLERQLGVLKKILASKSYGEYKEEFYDVIKELGKTLTRMEQEEPEVCSSATYREARNAVKHTLLFRYLTQCSIAMKGIRGKVKSFLRCVVKKKG